jgi:hypothetical protein
MSRHAMTNRVTSHHFTSNQVTARYKIESRWKQNKKQKKKKKLTEAEAEKLSERNRVGLIAQFNDGGRIVGRARSGAATTA